MEPRAWAGVFIRSRSDLAPALIRLGTMVRVRTQSFGYMVYGYFFGEAHEGFFVPCEWYAQGESNPCFRRERATS